MHNHDLHTINTALEKIVAHCDKAKELWYDVNLNRRMGALAELQNAHHSIKVMYTFTRERIKEWDLHDQKNFSHALNQANQGLSDVSLLCVEPESGDAEKKWEKLDSAVKTVQTIWGRYRTMAS
ncbi:MAG: hypothetical protein PHO89_04750 [Methylacidiphilaceae bacterium]|nr:hypothetical protein [Candidatus Methylacidiphilaceae bacterium]